MSARELSLLAGLSHGLVALIESGFVAQPSIGTSSAIARVIGVSLDWLINGTGNEPTLEQIQAAVATARASHVEPAKGAA